MLFPLAGRGGTSAGDEIVAADETPASFLLEGINDLSGEKAPDSIENKSRRVRMEEHWQAARNQADRLMHLRDARDSGLWRQLLMVAQALLLCGLPYRRTSSRQISRRARLAGDVVTVTFTCCDPDVEMPFGSDRTLLHWLVDRAIRSESPNVTWQTAIEFLRDAGLSDSGPNYRDLRVRFERISALAITIVRERAGEQDRLIIPIIEESHLPASIDLKMERNGSCRLIDEAFGFKLNPRFWSEVKEHHVPVPWDLIRATRKQSQLQDEILFLFWRSYAARTESVIPWSAILEQSGSQDSNPWRIKGLFKQALRTIKVIDSAFPGQVSKKGVHIYPYKGFLPSGERIVHSLK